MKFPKYAIVGLVWATGMAGAQPLAPVVDSVALPASAMEPLKAAPVPLSASVRTHFVVLPTLEEDQTLSSEDVSGPALQIGTARAVADTSTVAHTQSALHWTTLPAGQQVAAINIQSTGAYGLRAGVLVDRLPDGALLRVYSQEHPGALIERSGAEINALLAQNEEAGEKGEAANTWWTPDVGAGDATLEVLLPAGISADALRISIPRVSHIYQNLSLPTDAEWAQVTRLEDMQRGLWDTCRSDMSCTQNYQTERNTVARMMFTAEDGMSYLCTGTLLNNTKGDFVPYFMTANHCISTQTVASTLQTNWLYHSSSCNSGRPSAQSATRSAGATLLYATATTDSSLLRLNEMPPMGVSYAGWEIKTEAPLDHEVYGLHHPDGDLLKYSYGVISDLVSCKSTGNLTFSCEDGDSNGSFYKISWIKGNTEGGSSGSALFAAGRVVGTLYGGNSRCSDPRGHSYYGRFDRFFAEGASRWLDPSKDAIAP